MIVTNMFSISRLTERRRSTGSRSAFLTDKSNIARWGHTGGRDRRCRGNTWFVPYETIQRRAKERPHPATFPGPAGDELHPAPRPNESGADAGSVSRDWKFRGGGEALWPDELCRIRDRRRISARGAAAGSRKCVARDATRRILGKLRRAALIEVSRKGRTRSKIRAASGFAIG